MCLKAYNLQKGELKNTKKSKITRFLESAIRRNPFYIGFAKPIFYSS
jgi:hypothetical protein